MFLNLNDLKEVPMDAELSETLQDAKVAVTLATPLISYMLFRCKIRFVENLPPIAFDIDENGKGVEIRTACAAVTESENLIFIDPDFWKNFLQNRKQRAMVLLHEVLHIFLDHNDRLIMNHYNPQLWNIATDYHINLVGSGAYPGPDGEVLYNERYRAYFEVPEWMLYETKYIGLSSDEIYHLLLEEQKEDNQNDNGNGQGSGQGSGQCSGQDSGQDSGQGSGQGSGHGKTSFDHVPLIEGAGDTTLQRMNNRKTAVEAATNAMQSNSIGSNEGELARFLNDMLKPQVHYRDYLAEVISRSTKERRTYRKCSRRNMGNIIFPAWIGESISIVYGFDSSGSMGEEDYKRVTGELSGIVDQYDSWKIYLVSCDTRVNVIGTFSSEEGDDLESMIANKFVGGGGTDMAPIAAYADELIAAGEDVNACIIVTDGYIPTDTLEKAFSEECVNLVIVPSTGNRKLTLENAEVIHCS